MNRPGESELLSCKNLNFSYKDRQVLKDISLSFRAGEFVGLLGKNGAGKSTLLSCLAGLQPCQADELLLGGLQPYKAARAEVARLVSIVPQEHDEIFPFTAIDVVVMGRTPFFGPFTSPGRREYELARQVMAELYIEHLAERIYTTLSGGERQMVNVARALVQTRRLVFLDEPTNHLDYRNRYQILQSLKRQCRQHNSCIVACLHDPNHASHFADRVIMLDGGRVAAEGVKEEVLTPEAVSRLYDIPVGGRSGGIEPRFIQPSFAGKVLLLVGGSGEGKTTALQELVKRNGARRIGGIVCPGTWKNGRRYSQEVNRLDTGETTLFTRRVNVDGSGPFDFFEEGQQLADKALEAEHHCQSDCVIVDEVGPMELAGKGHGAHLSALLSLDTARHIWAVRPGIVDHVCDRWLLVEPVVVHVTAVDALERMQSFLEG